MSVLYYQEKKEWSQWRMSYTFINERKTRSKRHTVGERGGCKIKIAKRAVCLRRSNKAGGLTIHETMFSGRPGSELTTANSKEVCSPYFNLFCLQCWHWLFHCFRSWDLPWESKHSRTRRNADTRSPAWEPSTKHSTETERRQRGARVLYDITGQYFSSIKIPVTSHKMPGTSKRATPDVRVKMFLQHSKCFLGQNHDGDHESFHFP